MVRPVGKAGLQQYLHRTSGLPAAGVTKRLTPEALALRVLIATQRVAA